MHVRRSDNEPEWIAPFIIKKSVPGIFRDALLYINYNFPNSDYFAFANSPLALTVTSSLKVDEPKPLPKLKSARLITPVT